MRRSANDELANDEVASGEVYSGGDLERYCELSRELQSEFDADRLDALEAAAPPEIAEVIAVMTSVGKVVLETGDHEALDAVAEEEAAPFAFNEERCGIPNPLEEESRPSSQRQTDRRRFASGGGGCVVGSLRHVVTGREVRTEVGAPQAAPSRRSVRTSSGDGRALRPPRSARMAT